MVVKQNQNGAGRGFLRRLAIGTGLLGVAAVASATDPDPEFNWSTQIGTLNTSLVDTLGANIGAIMALFAFFVAISLVWRLIRKAGARTR